MGPLDELTGDAGDGFGGGHVTNLSNGSAFVMEVECDFCETSTFSSGVIVVGCGYEVRNDARGHFYPEGGTFVW